MLTNQENTFTDFTVISRKFTVISRNFHAVTAGNKSAKITAGEGKLASQKAFLTWSVILEISNHYIKLALKPSFINKGACKKT
jgi:hypothetical protein